MAVRRSFVWSFAIAVSIAGAAVAAEDRFGIESPIVLPPFTEGPACSNPSNVKRVLAFAQDNAREFMQGVAYGLRKAAEDRGIEYRAFLANNDPTLQIEQLEALLADNVGGVVVSPVNPQIVAPSVLKLLFSGSYVGSIVPPPATEILNAPQYLTGKALGDAAAAYIRDELGGKANVAILTQDSIQFLAPRFVAIRDVLSELPGVTIVADISPQPVDESGGYATMSTILLAHSHIDVVLGADTVVLGALKALRDAGRDRPDQFLGGIDGEPEAVAEIKAGGPYKISISLNSPVFAYAMGQHAADWLEGKRIPQAMDILPTALTAGNLSQYEADLADPGAVYDDPIRRASYLKMYGSICYDTRDQFINFPWSSEAN